MKNSDIELYRILGMLLKCILLIVHYDNFFLAQRTFTHDSWSETNKMVLDKVLSDERSTAYITDIQDINKWWLEYKESNWYKSKQMITLLPYTGWRSIKKFPFNKKLAMHLLHYHQVRYTI